MRRPLGITILAVINIAAAFLFIGSDIIIEEHPHIGIYIALVVVSVLVSYALWNLQSWVRWFMITTYGIGLIETIDWIANAIGRYDKVDILLALGCSTFLIWCTVYMFTRVVRTAFEHRSLRRSKDVNA